MKLENLHIKQFQNKDNLFWAANVSLDDIYKITRHLDLNNEDDNTIIKSALDNYHLGALESYDLSSLVSNEKNIVEYMATYSFIKKFYAKIHKQLENLYSPLMKFKGITEHTLNVNDQNILLTQNINIKTKFNFSETKSFLENQIDKNNPEQLLKVKKYIEETAGFAISRTNLEKVLKGKGLLESQIEKGLTPFVYSEIQYATKVIYPIMGNYNPNERITFLMDDYIESYNDNTLGFDPNLLLSLYTYIEKILENTKSFYNKINLLLKSDEIKHYRFEYLQFQVVEKNKVKMSGLFQDNQGNPIDVIDHFINSFKLSNDDVNEFVNSRKRNSIKLLESNNEIFTYDVEDIKYSMLLESTILNRQR